MCASDLSIWNICSESSGCVHSASSDPPALIFLIACLSHPFCLAVRKDRHRRLRKGSRDPVDPYEPWLVPELLGVSEGEGETLLLDFRGLLSFYRSGILPFILQPPLRRLAREKTLKKNGPINNRLSHKGDIR